MRLPCRSVAVVGAARARWGEGRALAPRVSTVQGQNGRHSAHCGGREALSLLSIHTLDPAVALLTVDRAIPFGFEGHVIHLAAGRAHDQRLASVGPVPALPLLPTRWTVLWWIQKPLDREEFLLTSRKNELLSTSLTNQHFVQEGDHATGLLPRQLLLWERHFSLPTDELPASREMRPPHHRQYSSPRFAKTLRQPYSSLTLGQSAGAKGQSRARAGRGAHRLGAAQGGHLGRGKPMA